MRGRRPKPSVIREAQGNPGKRRIPKAAEIPPAGPGSFPFPVSADAKTVFDLVGPELKRMNMMRASDEPAFWRYCDTFARYWRVTEEMRRFGGETYKCKTVGGDTMLRLLPQFVVQERLARRLDSMEDRFGLTPMSRQQYMLALARSSAPAQLPLDAPSPVAPLLDADDAPPSVIGAFH